MPRRLVNVVSTCISTIIDLGYGKYFNWYQIGRNERLTQASTTTSDDLIFGIEVNRDGVITEITCHNSKMD